MLRSKVSLLMVSGAVAGVCRREVPNAEVRVLEAGHSARYTATGEIAALVQDLATSSKRERPMTLLR
jgi:hypothetical protein